MKTFVVAFALSLLCGAAAGQPTYDVIIHGGRVFDGTANPWRYADVAIEDGRIAAVGDLDGASAETSIDATGLYVAPGFIDVHAHAGAALAGTRLNSARALLAQGITTVVINPDGGGPVAIAEQMASLRENGIGVNAAPLIGHGAVRRHVMRMADRRPTSEELAQMKALIREAMEAGAWGLSSGLFYAPGSYSETDEVIALAKVAAAYNGVYSSHIRDESDYSVGVVAAVDEVITVAREGELPGIVTHIKALGPNVWGASSELVDMISSARREGVEIYADQYPYEASATSITGALVPRWALVGGEDSLLARLNEPETHARVRRGMLQNFARRGGADRLQIRLYTPEPSLGGMTLAEIAEARGVEPVDLAISMLKQGGAKLVSFNMQEEDIHRLMRQPWTMTSSDGALVTLGQGVPHPRSFGAFPHKIRKYVLEEGVLSLPQAIHSMTGLPAGVFRMSERGMLRPGMAADVIVFDLAGVRSPATYQDPHHLAEGMVHVLVNGAFGMRDGEFTDALGGEVLTR